MRRITARALLLAAGMSPALALAQVVTDGSVGARVALTGPTYTILPSLGMRSGANLLQSFSIFNVGAGQTAIFSATSGDPFAVTGIRNVIARVTGGTASTIDGTLRSAIEGSSLYFINPSGIMFGPTAAINVPGAFHASTAHYLKMADGTRIEMRASPGVTLSAAPPAAFGFEGTAAAITLTGAQLRAGQGQRISIAGGDVTLAPAATGRAAALVAPSGTIGVVAAQSAGEALIDTDGLRAEGFGAMGALTIRGSSLVSANEGTARGGGGAISLAGGSVVIDHASVEARTAFGAGRGIAISAADSIAVNGGSVVSVTTGAGDAGPLRLQARDITLSNGSLVDTSCDPSCTTGAGGRLSIAASGSLNVVGDNATVPTYLVSNSFGGGRTGTIDIHAGALVASDNAFIQAIATKAGDSSSISIASDSIALTNGAQVDASTRGAGHGGNVTIANTGAIRIEGTRIPDAQAGVVNPSGFFANAESSGSAGNVVVSTRTLEVLRGGEISSTARRGSTGNGGRVTITASGLVRVSGVDAGKSSGIVSNTFAGGSAGDLEISADAIEVTDEGRIQVQSEGAGHAGSVRIRGREMTLASRGQVSSDARAGGDGGTIDVALTERLTIRDANSGLFAKTYGRARGGAVVVAAPEIVIDGGGLFAGTDGSGTGGDLTVRAGRTLEVRNSGSITSESRSTGLAGSISVASGDRLAMDGGRITTAARSADGGDIAVDVARLATLHDALVETQVGSGQGSGGNIVFRVPTLVMLSSVVSANAYGGSGGNIRIGTTTFIPSPDSRVTASSTLGIDGTITFESPAIDPTGGLVVPPPSFLDAGSVLAGRCGPRLAGRASSLVVVPSATALAGPDEWRICTPVAMAK